MHLEFKLTDDIAIYKDGGSVTADEVRMEIHREVLTDELVTLDFEVIEEEGTAYYFEMPVMDAVKLLGVIRHGALSPNLCSNMVIAGRYIVAPCNSDDDIPSQKVYICTSLKNTDHDVIFLSLNKSELGEDSPSTHIATFELPLDDFRSALSTIDELIAVEVEFSKFLPPKKENKKYPRKR